MSDTSQGPGWWKASDGRWYAPDLRPKGEVTPASSANPKRASATPMVVALAVGAVIVLIVLLHQSGSQSASGSTGSGWAPQSGVTAYGQPLNLDLTSFTDPATDGSGYTTDETGTDHFAIVNVSATNNGNSALPSSLPVTIAAFGSDGNVYSRLVETPNGDSVCAGGSDTTLSPSQTLSYCAGFVFPESVTVSRIEVSGNQGAGSGTVSWNVTDNFAGWSGS